MQTKTDFPKLISAAPAEGFGVYARFADGVCGTADLRADIFCGDGEMARPLRDVDYFRRLKIGQFGDIVWPNGFDFCPDALYLRLVGKTYEEFCGGGK